jgi:hypothetical protein
VTSLIWFSMAPAPSGWWCLCWWCQLVCLCLARNCLGLWWLFPHGFNLF